MMPRDYTAEPPTAMRRSDRAIDDQAWIAEFLGRAPVGVLATVHDGQPFLNSNLFVYDPGAHVLFMHTARVGRTRANIDAELRVCFSTFEIGRLLPADTALEMSVEYAGVVAFGRAALAAEAEARHGMQLLLDKYFSHLRPDVDYRAITADELARTAVYQITIDSWSGKRKQVAADFPSAFRYGDM